MPNRDILIHTLLLIGMGGALFSSNFLGGAALLTVIFGGVFIARKTLLTQGWMAPREFRLIHFAFWFFLLTSLISWALEGFSYFGLKTLGGHIRFILLWPLLVAFTVAGIKGRTVFAAAVFASGVTVLLFLVSMLTMPEGGAHVVAQRFGGGINPIMFGNLALLTAILCGVSVFHFQAHRQTGLAVVALVLAVAGVLVAMMSQTRSNLVALPILLVFFLFLVPRRWRLPAVGTAVAFLVVTVACSDRFLELFEEGFDIIALDSSIQLRLQAWDIAWQVFKDSPTWGPGLSGYHSAVMAQEESPVFLVCCSDHAHSDVFNTLATKGWVGALSWLFLLVVPFAVFIRYVRNPDAAIAALAMAGSLIPVAYFLFGLTESTFDRSLYITFYLFSIAAIAAALFNELSASYQRQRSVKVSATIITKNEEDHIADCLRSARQVADEIIVLDSGSSDRTVEIARQYADLVEVTDWPGFGVQKQRALEKATGDWVLSIDADERITEELAREINHTLSAPDADAYKLPWAVTLYGKRLDFGRSGRAPLRLFRREGVRFSDAMVHEKILIPSGRTVRTLRGRLTHYTHRDFGHSLDKSASYAWLGSREKFRKGKRTRTLFYPTFRGLLTFLQVYVIRLGFLDGAVGFLMAVIYAQGSFNKYAGLWTLTRQEKQQRCSPPNDH